MPKKKKEVVLEYKGIRVGDTVILIGIAMPRNKGKVVSIVPDKYDISSDNMFFKVELKNEDEYDNIQQWEVDFEEFKKVSE